MIDKELARLMTLQANTDSDSESDFESERDVFKIAKETPIEANRVRRKARQIYFFPRFDTLI